MLSAMGVGIVTRSASVRVRALTIPLLLCAAGAILYPIVFPDALETMLERVESAHAYESRFSSLGIFARAFADYTGFIDRIDSTPLLGWALAWGAMVVSSSVIPRPCPWIRSRPNPNGRAISWIWAWWESCSSPTASCSSWSCW